MKKSFEDIVTELGWIKPYNNVYLWYTNYKDGLRACFDINRTLDTWSGHEDKLNIEIVKGSLNFFPKTVFNEDSKSWVLPLLASDYFAHREDYENELVWAKKAMKNNSKLTPLQFSQKIRERL